MIPSKKIDMQKDRDCICHIPPSISPANQRKEQVQDDFYFVILKYYHYWLRYFNSLSIAPGPSCLCHPNFGG